MTKAVKDRIVKTMEKKTGKSGKVYRFVRLGRYYGVFHKNKPVNMKEAMRDCGFGRTREQTSYQAMGKFWPAQKGM